MSRKTTLTIGVVALFAAVGIGVGTGVILSRGANSHTAVTMPAIVAGASAGTISSLPASSLGSASNATRTSATAEQTSTTVAKVSEYSEKELRSAIDNAVEEIVGCIGVVGEAVGRATKDKAVSADEGKEAMVGLQNLQQLVSQAASLVDSYEETYGRRGGALARLKPIQNDLKAISQAATAMFGALGPGIPVTGAAAAGLVKAANQATASGTDLASKVASWSVSPD